MICGADTTPAAAAAAVISAPDLLDKWDPVDLQRCPSWRRRGHAASLGNPSAEKILTSASGN